MSHMTGQEYIRIALNLVEESLIDRHAIPSVQGLALRIGYSVHHFSRLFTALAGIPPSEYIAHRSLSLAAARIRESEASLAAIAAGCGYENYEVFSRAFRRHFGVGPRESRLHPELSLPLTPPLILPPRSSSLALVNPEPELIKEDAHLLGGMWFFMDGSERSFHRPWSIFKRQALRLVGMTARSPWYQYAVWTDGGESGMNILCARELGPEAEFLQDPFFSVRRVPAMGYLRFLHLGGLENLAASYQYIYGEYLADRKLPLTSGWEFQRFGMEDGGPLEICIPMGPG